MCWTVAGAFCRDKAQEGFAGKLLSCLECEFLEQVRREQGETFRFLVPGEEIETVSHLLNDHKLALETMASQEATLEKTTQQLHESSMELAMGISEFFAVLSEVKRGNLDARVSSETLASSEEMIAQLGTMINETIDEIRKMIDLSRRQEAAIQELSTPVLQLWESVVAVPIIGTVDTRRCLEMMERVLGAIVELRSRFVILDITGVQIVDTKTADHFLKLVRAAQLVGARCVLTGVQPAVAQTLVELGIDLTSIQTMRDLQAGLRHCLREMQASK